MPEIDTENWDVPPGDGSTRPKQRAVPAQRDQEIDRVRVEVHAAGALGRPLGEVFLEGDVDLVLMGETGQAPDASGHILVLRTSHDADAPQAAPFTHPSTHRSYPSQLSRLPIPASPSVGAQRPLQADSSAAVTAPPYHPAGLRGDPFSVEPEIGQEHVTPAVLDELVWEPERPHLDRMLRLGVPPAPDSCRRRNR